MALFGDLSELVSAVKGVSSELRQIREILAPANVSGPSFRTGAADPDSGPDTAWISQTDEVAGYLREQLTKHFGRPLTDEEEIDNGIRSPAYDGHGRASDGFSTGTDPGKEDQV